MSENGAKHHGLLRAVGQLLAFLREIGCGNCSKIAHSEEKLQLLVVQRTQKHPLHRLDAS